MSRSTTSTPPPAYFPQRTSTPTMRHSAPTVTSAHFRPIHHATHLKKKAKSGAAYIGSLAPISGKKSKPAPEPTSSDSLGLSFGEVPVSAPSNLLLHRSNSVASDFSRVTSSADSFNSHVDREGATTPTPSFVTTDSTFLTTPLQTPASSEASFPIHDPAESIPILAPTATHKASWVPNFGKMAKAVVTTGMNMTFGASAEKKAKRLASPKPESPAPPPVQFIIEPQPSHDELQRLADDDAMERRRQWAEAERTRIMECARLCSQWPQSRYNVCKWGPNGAQTFYEPQSFSNPQYVAGIMQRQADLERQMATSATNFFACQRRESSDDSSDRSVDSYASSSQPSPTASMAFSHEGLATALSESKTAAALQAAMMTPLTYDSVNSSQVSLSLPSSPKSLKGARSLTELDMLASSMALSKDDSMDIDQIDTASISAASEAAVDSRQPHRHLSMPFVRPTRAQSCGAKRPNGAQDDEEDKRRKVDEAMVVEEALETGVMMRRDKTLGQNRQISASTPNLSQTQSTATFGVVVKTSDTHPIIISPFFPPEVLQILSEHVVMPRTGPFSTSPLLLASDVDVPSLLLQPIATPQLVPSPVLSGYSKSPRMIGNLLLSSCPGKRVRMEGPVKGRGPVCRDLATDLRRIKSEGVGCLVCCLDDTELALLGVPWDTYRQVAAETGLDVIRVPMPDGFTPACLPLFDSQVTLIATKYSLQGINVLVHCRGGVGRAGLTACAWAIKMGFVQPHPSLSVAQSQAQEQWTPQMLEHQITMSVVERVIAMLRARRGLKAIESFEQVHFLVEYVRWLRTSQVESELRA